MCEVIVCFMTKGGGGLGVISAGTGERDTRGVGVEGEGFSFFQDTDSSKGTTHYRWCTELRDAQSLMWVVYD